jgi:rhodanese-related sulfurtransferase
MKLSAIFTVLAVLLLGWFVFNQFVPLNGLANLSDKEFQKQITANHNAVLIDVREPNEYKSGYIPGAINIPLSQLRTRIGEIPKDKQVYLYCRSGNRSRQAAKILTQEGHKELAHLQGGITAWSGKIKK